MSPIIMIALGTIVVLQAAVLTGLVLQHRRRRRGEAGLRESEARFRHMANETPVMVWTATPDTLVDYCNPTVLEFTGLSLEQLLGEGWLGHLHPDDVESAQRTYLPAFEARAPFQLEYRLRRADGVYRWILDSGVPRFGPDGIFAGYIGSAIDITERKAIEQALVDRQAELRDAYERNRDLAGRLIDAQEMERTRIARDLHDDLSQQLAAVAILTSNLKRDVGRSASAGDVDRAFGTLLERITAASQNVRNLSHELHPSVLEHAGLGAALQRLCSDIEQRHRLEVICRAPEDIQGLTLDEALALFRVAQEALTNAVRHANARVILVELVETPEAVQLEVTDDGIGFVPADLSERGLGLRSIDERVRLNKGEVRLNSQPGTGTSVQVRFPRRALAHDS
jgi:PAS domain S-box-containing protein